MSARTALGLLLAVVLVTSSGWAQETGATAPQPTPSPATQPTPHAPPPATPPAQPSPVLTRPQAPLPPPADGGTPKMEVSPLEFRFGEVWAGTPMSREFTIKNTGDGALSTKVQSSCGCTVATTPKSPLPPGESTTFTITYDTKRPGPANKTVTITSNDPQRSSIVIKVEGTVNPVFTMTPSSAISFPSLEVTSVSTQMMRLENKYEKPLSLKLKEGQNFGTFDIELREVEPQKVYELVATTKPPLRMGSNHATVELETSDPKIPPLQVSVFANAQPRVFSTPFSIFVTPNRTESYDEMITVITQSAPQAKVTEARCDIPGFAFEILPPEPQPEGVAQITQRIKVRVPKFEDIPETGGMITLMTDDKAPEYQKLEIKVVRRVPPARPATTQPAAPLAPTTNRPEAPPPTPPK